MKAIAWLAVVLSALLAAVAFGSFIASAWATGHAQSAFGATGFICLFALILVAGGAVSAFDKADEQ